MITLIILAVIVVIIVGCENFYGTRFLSQTDNLKEITIVRKFNRLLKAINGDNLSIIKEKLLETLEKYRAVKAAQYTEDRTNITEAIKSVEEQEDIIRRTIQNKTTTLRNRKSANTITEEAGASAMYEIDIYNDTHAKLVTSLNNLRAKLNDLDARIVQCESNLALRRAKIVSLIADSISINDHSYIDLKLDSLEKAFQHEVNKQDNAKFVDEKMGLTTSVPSTKLEFDLEEYKKRFNEL